jgi:glycosyltransferase involved in cell wall biosynthesis
MEPRKNLPLVIDVWRELRRHREVGLTLVGRRRGDFPPLPPEPGLRVFEGAGDAELPGLYSGCVACLYPSYYEGFGLPVLEAMQCGSPVVASCDGALMEVSGGAAMHVEAGDRKGWLEAMRAVLDHPELRETMKERSLARAASFSWRRTAALTRKVYKMARGRFAV